MLVERKRIRRIALILCLGGFVVFGIGMMTKMPEPGAFGILALVVSLVLWAWEKSTTGTDTHMKFETDEEVLVRRQIERDARKAAHSREREAEREAAERERATWNLQQYADAIAGKVTNWTPCEDSGLEFYRTYVRTLGQEIHDGFGFKGMQEVWYAIHREMGPGPCSDLTRIWDGVGQWQK